MCVLKSLGRLVLYALIFVFSQVAAERLLSRFYLLKSILGGELEPLPVYLLKNIGLLLIIAGTIIVVFGVLSLIIRGKNPITYLQFRRLPRQDLLAMPAIGIGFSIFITCLFSLLRVNFALPDVTGELIYDAMGANLFQILLAVGVVVPFYEEFFFRGLVFQELKQWGRLLPALLIQTVIFGAFHFNWFQFIYTVPAGLILALIGDRYQSLWAPILIHIGWNSTSLIFSGLLPPDAGADILGAFLLVGAGLLALSLYYIFIVRPRPLTVNKGD